MEYHGKLYGKIGNKYFDTSKTSDDYDGLEAKNKQLLDEIERLKSKINNQNKLLSDLYLATCDFDVSLFYPEKVEDFDLASNNVWVYINENNLQ